MPLCVVGILELIKNDDRIHCRDEVPNTLATMQDVPYIRSEEIEYAKALRRLAIIWGKTNQLKSEPVHLKFFRNDPDLMV
jgi:hypothetical protein